MLSFIGALSLICTGVFLFLYIMFSIYERKGRHAKKRPRPTLSHIEQSAPPDKRVYTGITYHLPDGSKIMRLHKKEFLQWTEIQTNKYD